MHDIWNPWHGCKKISEGCQNCYMYYLDKSRNPDINSSIVVRTNNFDYPLKKDRYKNYKIKSGEMIRVNMTSDTFIQEADPWRDEMWEIIKKRSDVSFYILTKRANRMRLGLPSDWGDGYENVILNVTCENQTRADERIPYLLKVPAKHKGIFVAPFIGEINIEKYLTDGSIELVMCGGENYAGARPCNYDWVKSLSEQCEKYKVNFNFIETGNVFIKDGKKYKIFPKSVQTQQAYKSELNKKFYDINFKLFYEDGTLVEKDNYIPVYNKNTCLSCSSRMTCNGCSGCGKCGNVEIITKEELLKITGTKW